METGRNPWYCECTFSFGDFQCVCPLKELKDLGSPAWKLSQCPAVSHFVVSSKNSKVIWLWILWLIFDKWVFTQKSLNI